MNTSSAVVLVFVEWFSPAFKAGGIIQYLKNIIGIKNITFYILTSNYDLGGTINNVEITNKWLVYSDNVKVFYLYKISIYEFLSKQLDIIRPTAIYINGIFSLKYSFLPLFFISTKWRFLKIRKIVSTHGMLHEGAMKRKYIIKRIYLFVINVLLDNSFYFHATDNQEVKNIIQYFKQKYFIFNIPCLPPANRTILFITSKSIGVLKIVYLARIDYKKNLHFIITLLNNYIWNGKIILDIYGNQDNEYAKYCKSIVSNFDCVQTNWYDMISNDLIYSVLNDYHISLLPTLGENYGYSIVEAFICGKPVIISDQTPWRRLAESSAGFDLPLAEPQSWIDAIKTFLKMDHDEYANWSKGAWEYGMEIQNDGKLIEMQYLKMFNT